MEQRTPANRRRQPNPPRPTLAATSPMPSPQTHKTTTPTLHYFT
ncbi:MAG: hypothetical protein SF052_11215 [Bacteroidia bacterium]|nr:hypothetical protein [Bacteroidia bacterium]